MKRRFGPRAIGGRGSPFGMVSARERKEADLFYAELMGLSPPRNMARYGAREEEAWEQQEHYGRDTFVKPPRPANAPKGHAFVADLMSREANPDREPKGAAWIARENAIRDQIVAGNVPPFLWNWKEIEVKTDKYTAVYLVTPDVLAIGADDDFVRMPMDAITSQEVANHYGCLLPTAKMVNQIFEKADVKLSAITKQYNWKESSRTDKGPDRAIKGAATRGYLVHNDAIEAQLNVRLPGPLVAGHKKEVIVAANMVKGSLYFCGFHAPSKVGPGNPNGFFQKGWGPSPHPVNFADYAQGTRLVNPYMTVNGETKLVATVLNHKDEHVLISDARIADPRYPTQR